MISTKGRYSIRILLDLAQHRSGKYIPMKDVAARQDISLKYIERLTPALRTAGLIESVHGIGGGYRLTREPEEYTLWEILVLSEGDLAPVSCLTESSNIRVWRSLVSRLNGVQEALSSNLNTRTKNILTLWRRDIFLFLLSRTQGLLHLNKRP